MNNIPTGTVTFLFTDIEGSTQLWEQHPEAMQAALARHDAILRQAIESHGGHVFKTVGDAFCATFTSASDAVLSALDAQRAIQAESWGETVIKVRMGLHSGAAEVRDNDYFGPTLNRVARLMSAGHGGQTLLSAITRELAQPNLPPDAELRDMGERSLKDLIRPEHIYQLTVAGLQTDFPPLKTLEAFRTNLPAQLTSFIGREKEIVTVKSLIAEHRLTTLTGAGGTGKTRLSLQVAAEVLDSFKDGVWFIELAPLSDPALVLDTIASVLGVREEQGRALLATLLDWLSNKELLFILDNCEHLVEACAKFAAAGLQSSRGMRILASSREALGIAGETTYHVPSLEIPNPKDPISIDTVTQYTAVRLFIERATQSLGTFSLTNANAPVVVQICYRLDGIPLAIELAAARVKVLRVEQIAERLDDRFRLLTGGSRAALPRQQTLRALIDWSYDLLSESERMLLRRLSAFVGGWTLEAAETVCADENLDSLDVLDLMTHLVDKSLVGMDELAVEPRYRMLETIRQYAHEKLFEMGEGDVMRARHRDWFAQWAEQGQAELTGPRQAAWLAHLEDEHDNLRAALEWALASEPETGLRLAAAIWQFWDIRGYTSEGSKWLGKVLEECPAQSVARVKALIGAGWLAIRKTDGAQAGALFEAGLSLSRDLDYKPGIAECLYHLGEWTEAQGDTSGRAEALYTESVQIWQELHDRGGIAHALGPLASLALRHYDYERAAALFGESLMLFRELGDTREIAGGLWNLTEVAIAQRDYAHARALTEESLILYQELSDKHGIATALRTLGEIARQDGESLKAQTQCEQSLALFRELGDSGCAALTLLCLGQIAHQSGELLDARRLSEEALTLCRETQNFRNPAMILDLLGLLGRVALARGENSRAAQLFAEGLTQPREYVTHHHIALLEGCASMAATLDSESPLKAVRLFGAAEALRTSIRAPLTPAERAEHDRYLAAARARVDETAFMFAWAEGGAMTMEQAVALALDATDE
jgi:predicted ATPase/class 3 adenylate cyclase